MLRLDAGDRWSALETEVVRNFAEPDLSANCAAAIPLLYGYAAARLAIALRARGLLVEAGAPASREAIRTALRPVPAMAKLLSASLDVLARRGWVETITHGFRAAGDIVSAEAELARVATLLGRDHADKAGIVSVIDRTVPRLPEVIAGEVEPNQADFSRRLDGSCSRLLPRPSARRRGRPAMRNDDRPFSPGGWRQSAIRNDRSDCSRSARVRVQPPCRF